ncbi:MAG: hypothetical protein ACKV2Q_10670 [Planctomycetaceae bacterium]
MNRNDWFGSWLRIGMAAIGVLMASGGDAEMLSAPNVIIAAETPVTVAATVDEIAKVFDLRTLSLPEGATADRERQLGMLNYDVKGALKSAFVYQQQQLTKSGWKELPGTQIAETYCTGMFQKSGFVVVVTTYDPGTPDKKGLSQVSLKHLGNVRLAKLPVVKGAKTVFANEATASYSVTMKPPAAAEATRKLLLEAGWEPFGSHLNPPDSEVLSFKQNAIRLQAYVGMSPMDKNGASVVYSAEVMSADLPAPPNAEKLDYADHTKTLQFESPADFDTVAKFYQQRLAKLGWKPTVEQLTKQENKFRQIVGLQVFRNSAKDFLTLDLEPAVEPSEGKTRVKLTHLTALEAAAIEKREKEAALKFVAKQKAEEEAAKLAQKEKPKSLPKSALEIELEKAANDAIADALKGTPAKKGTATSKDKDAVSVPIPENAKKVTQTSGNVLQVKLPAGQGQAAAKFIRDQLVAAKWEADKDEEIGKTSGNLTFTKASQKITLTFVDAGVGEVNLMLIGVGVPLEPGKADPDAKGAAKPEAKPAK